MRYPRLSYIFIACLSVTVVSSVVAEDNSVSPETKKGRALAIYAPRPRYPYEAYAKWLTGSGIVWLSVDSRTGNVTSARMLKSTGHKILDEAALDAFRQWRFKPGRISYVRLPITFTMRGASY